MSDEARITTDYGAEGQKLFYDLFKHLGTLSSGSIVLMATFMTRFAEKPEWSFLIALALAGFVVSIAGSLVVMMTFAEAVHKGGTAPDDTQTVGSALAAISAFAFVGALLCLALFVFKNLY